MLINGFVSYLTAFFLVVVLSSASSVAQETLSTTELERIPSFKGRVAEVVVSGNRRTQTSLIDLNIRTKQGENYSPQIVKEDLKRLYKLDFFQQIVVDVKQIGDRLRVEFIVEENPILADIKFSGNDKLKEDDMKETLAFREGRIVSLRKITEGTEIILALASDKGLVKTEVEYEIEPRGDGVVDVVYKIEEGERKYIKKVELIGNSKIDEKKIKKNMYSKPKYFLSFITKRGLFKIEEIKRDSDRIKATYIDKGYLDVKVSEPDISYDEERDGYVVSFSIEEEAQYKVSRVTFSGELMENEDEIRPELALSPGVVFSSFVLQADIGGFDAGQASGAGQQVHVITVDDAHYGEIAFFLADQLPHERHGVLIDGEAAEGDACAVRDKRRRFAQRNDLGGARPPVWCHSSRFRHSAGIQRRV